MPPTFLKKMKCLALGCLFLLILGSCTARQKQNPAYPPPAALAEAPSLRQKFLQNFLQGRWCLARSLFLQTQEYYLRQDAFCSVARTYILAYNLHAYLGEKYPHLLDKAMIFAQQGLDCTNILFGPDGQPRKGVRDEEFQKLLDAQKWHILLKHLDTLNDPLFISVYARKATRKALQTDSSWARKFLDRAHAIDSRQGWILFLIQDWQLQLMFEKESRRKTWIEQRITTLYDLVEPCDQPFAEQ